MSQPAGIDEALTLVANKFKGVTDKDGEPYVMHCLRVMMGTEHPHAQLVGLMHDLVEDTDVTLEDLQSLGFPPEVVEGVTLVTHEDSISYTDYVVRLSHNEIARQVKLSDLRDNSSITRVLYREGNTERDVKRIGRYVLSYQFLTHRIDEASYRRQMADCE